MKRLMQFADRVLPTLLMATSTALLTAGVLSYAPSAFGNWQTPEPSIGGGDPLFESPGPSPSDLQSPFPGSSPTAPASATPAPSDSALPTDLPSGSPTSTPTIGLPSGTPDPTARPTGTPKPTARPTGAPNPSRRGFASRIRIPSQGIDLPVVPSDLLVPGNVDYYPLCDVAMYMVSFVQPGENGTTYIYAHAQRGMFLALLRASLKNDGASLIGALVEVYTSDNRLHLYEIFRVKRHATDLAITNVGPGVHQLVLQTSEGYAGHVPKLQIAARPIAVVPASRSDANPRPDPRVCLPH
jgi:hypothetical protein